MLALLDDIRARLTRVFKAADDGLVLAISGTGTSAMEAAVANLVEPGRRALAIVTGYFGDRLANMLARHGATVDRIDVEWGRAVDPEAVRRQLSAHRYDLVTIVHAETSTGVLNPIEAVAQQAREHDALILVDAVTSLGTMPLKLQEWGIDACFSCSQKGLGAPSGLSPLALSSRALARRVTCRNFAFDLTLLEDYWVRRKYHHTISAPLVYALTAALEEVEEETIESRWVRHQNVHLRFVKGIEPLGLEILPPQPERLWSLNAVRVPEGVNEAAVRSYLLEEESIEIGAGLGPLAGRIWRVGLMGSGATPQNVDRLLRAVPGALTAARQ
jgi:alanine-glyoxylate transaminase/serine-glyoxylate transaminase/serine-pyruvate transaminase